MLAIKPRGQWCLTHFFSSLRPRSSLGSRRERSPSPLHRPLQGLPVALPEWLARAHVLLVPVALLVPHLEEHGERVNKTLFDYVVSIRHF